MDHFHKEKIEFMGHNLEQCSRCDADKSEDMPCSNCGQTHHKDEHMPTREKSNDKRKANEAFEESARKGLKEIQEFISEQLEFPNIGRITLLRLLDKVNEVHFKSVEAWRDNLD